MIRFYDETFTCPIGPWKALTVYRHDPDNPIRVSTPNPEQVKARSYWESIVDLAGKAAQMAQVVTSGEAAADVIATRRASCAACPARKVVGEDSYCGDCGCGTKPWAKLDKKLTYAYLPCPRQRPGFSNSLATGPASS